jgi:hypothetical protein
MDAGGVSSGHSSRSNDGTSTPNMAIFREKYVKLITIPVVNSC